MVQEGFGKEQFERLFEEHFDDLVSFVYSYVRNKEVTRDVVHDAFFTLWENRELVDLSLSPKAYLYKMARNGALNYLRHQKVIADNEKPLAYSLKQAAREIAHYERALVRLSEHVRELPEQQRRVLEGCFVDGKSYKEIAATLDISVNTVKTHLQRAMRYLRALMRDELFLLFLLRKPLTVSPAPTTPCLATPRGAR
ncbi:MAG: RNA polymerase sigma-70 factor [Odoribacteraceae bacterium]|jgi:RNA polymerase sigma-70 factor (ECF subfamily)|nr:RNA polymerase sigma-70 factor [Odoribacteraceae bacterium]